MEGLAPDAARDAVVEKAHDRGIVRRERLDCAEAHAQDFGRDRSDERRLGVGRREARPDQIARKEKRRDLPRRIGQGDIQNERPKRTKNAISPFSPVSASACPRRGRKTVA
jgi:hypothetical protein